jgi:hypothetical protein
MTEIEAVAWFRELTGEKNDVAVPDDTVLEYLRRGYEVLADELGIPYGTVEVALVANQQEYDLGSAVLQIVTATIGERRLRSKTIGEWQRAFVGWEHEEAGEPTEIAVLGRKVVLRPKPDVATVALSPELRLLFLRSPGLTDEGSLEGMADFGSHETRLAVMYGVLEWADHPGSQVDQAQRGNIERRLMHMIDRSRLRHHQMLAAHKPQMQVFSRHRGGIGR